MSPVVDVERYQVGDFVLEPSQARVLGRDGRPLALAPRLFGALLLFTERPGELIDKGTLMRALWPGLVVEENNLSQLVSALRRALGDGPQHSRYLQTVPRRGFRFIAPVHRLPPATSQRPGHPAGWVEGADDPVIDDAAARTGGSARRRWPGSAVGGSSAALVAISAGAIWHVGRRATDGATDPVVVAVLPFRPLDPDTRDELLETGMAESLIGRLSTVPGVVVRAIGSTRRYAGADQDPVRAARELDARWIVDGSLQRRDDHLRTTARLLHGADGSVAWSDRFEAPYADVFDLQDRISTQVGKALAPMLDARLPRTPTTETGEVGGTRSTEAYQLYLAGSRAAQGGRADRIEKAIALLNQALAIDPAYAQAWVGLAWAHRRRLWNADTLPAAVFEPANVALSRALASAPAFAEAHAGVGFSLYWFDFDWTGAERTFRGALSVNPSIAIAHYGLALLCLTQDRLDEGFAHIRTARELDPMAPVYNILEASFLLDRGQLAEARVRLQRALDIAPELWLTHVALGALHQAERRPDESVAALQRAVGFSQGSTRPKAMLAVQLAATGRLDESRVILDELTTASRIRYVPPTTLAAVQAALGQTSAALDALDQALLTRDTRLIYLKDDPNWAGLRQEPRFVALLKRLQLDGFGHGLSPV